MQFGFDPPQQFHGRRRVGSIRAARLRDMITEILDALLGQRVGAHPGFLTLARQQLIGLQNLEKFQEAAGRLAASVEKVERRVVGGGFLPHRKLQKRTLTDPLRTEQRGAAAPDHGCASGGHHRDDALDAGVAHRFLGAQHMTAGDMAGLVRDDPEQLVRVFRPQDQAAVDKDRLSAGDKRVELAVLNKIDADIVGLEPGGPPDRARDDLDVVLDLGIAQQQLRRMRRARREAQRRNQRRGQNQTMQPIRQPRCCHLPPVGRASYCTSRVHQPRRGLAGFSVTVSTSSFGLAGSEDGGASLAWPSAELAGAAVASSSTRSVSLTKGTPSSDSAVGAAGASLSSSRSRAAVCIGAIPSPANGARLAAS